MRLLTTLFAVFILLALAAVPAHAGVVFTLEPSGGALYGQPGQVLGWGLTIQNDDSGWLVITSGTYDQSTSIGTFTDTLTPQFDPASPQFILWDVAPNQSWSTAALGSYVIGDFASPGDMSVGDLDLLYDVHSTNLDPNSEGFDPFNDTVVGGQVLLPATVTDTDVPEPVTIATALIGLALLGLGKTARRRC